MASRGFHVTPTYERRVSSRRASDALSDNRAELSEGVSLTLCPTLRNLKLQRR